MSQKRSAGLAALMGLVLMTAMPARAAISLNFWLTDFTCTFTDQSGITTGIPCNGSSVQADLGPGDSARITAVLHYQYRDDGLNIGGLYRLPTGSSPTSYIETEYETAAFYAYSALCDGRSCLSATPGLIGLGSGFFQGAIGLNNVADDLNGQLEIFSGYSADPSSTIGFGVTASLRASALVAPDFFSQRAPGVAPPVPEPSTVALMLVGLGVLGAAGQLTTRASRLGSRAAGLRSAST